MSLIKKYVKRIPIVDTSNLQILIQSKHAFKTILKEIMYKSCI